MAYSSVLITVTGSAAEGQMVSASARITNNATASYPFRVKLYAVRDIYAVPGPSDLLNTFEQTIAGRASKTISGSFTMPAWDTIVLVMVYRLNSHWDFDGYTTRTVSYIPGPEPEPEPTDEELLYANWQRTGGTGSISYWRSIGSPLYYTPPPPTPTDEELLYANWQRTGGTGSMEYWRSIGSPLYFTPEPEPEPEYPSTDLKNIAITVIGVEYPSTDLKNIAITIIGVRYPSTDIRNIAIAIVGVEYPSTDIRNITIGVFGEPEPEPEEPEPEEPEPEPVKEEGKFPWVPVALVAGAAGLVVVAGIKSKKDKGGLV